MSALLLGFMNPTPELFTFQDATALFQIYGGWAHAIWKVGMGAVVVFTALQIMYAAYHYYFEGRSLNNAWVYPALAVCFLGIYPWFFPQLVELPVKLADALTLNGGSGLSEEYVQARQQQAESVEKVGYIDKVRETITFLTHLDEAVGVKVLMLISLVISTAIFLFLQTLQLVAMGILYVLGPLFLAAVAFQPLASYARNWAQNVVAVAFWPFFWKICLLAIVKIQTKVDPGSIQLNYMDPNTSVATWQMLVSMLVSSFVTLSIPFMAGYFFRSGHGGIVAAAGMAGMAKAQQAMASVAGGTGQGAMVGGPVGAGVGFMKGAADSAGIRGVNPPGLQAMSADAVQARRSPAAAASHQDAVQRHRDPDAKARHEEG